MAKIFWYGDAVSNTGFARVTHSVLEHLHKQHEVVVYGVNHNGDPHKYPYPIYPAAAVNPGDRFGIGRLQQVVETERPDYIIALNDIWMINQVWERIHFQRPQLKFKFIPYFPIDSERYPDDMLRYIKDWDFPVTFTQQQAERVLSHGVKVNKLGVIPHGVDANRFYELPPGQARKELGLPEDKFIVLNANRNQPRKRIDLTIKAFAEFAVDKPDTMLMLHMGEKDLGWDIKKLFAMEMKKRGLESNERLINSKVQNYMKAPSDDLLNKVYNAADIGINTSNGEGWGLVPFEHAQCRKAQVLPNHTSNKDIWENHAPLIDIATWENDKELLVERGLVDTKHAALLMTELYEDRVYRDQVASMCKKCTDSPQYRWDKVAEGFNQAIKHLEASK